MKKRIRAVGIVINEDKVLLMHRVKNGKQYYVFPGGGVEEGESIEEAVVRELWEETTLEIEVGKLLYRHIYDDGNEQFFYLCRYVSGTPKLGEGTESEEMKVSNKNYYNPMWYPVENIERLLLYPLEIRDWLIDDIKNNFADTPREATLKVKEIRHTL